MRQYEITYLISDNVPESDLNKVTGKIGSYITSLGGNIIKEEIWGRRKLAYPIKKQEFATYVTLNFNLDSEKANELEKNIFLTSKVIRHLMIVTNYGQEKLELTKEDIVDTDLIKETVGGDRSFEAIEGEKEDSKTLMSKREEIEVTPEEEKVVAEETEKPAKAKKTTKVKKTEEVAEVEEKKEEKPAKKTTKAKKETKTVAKKEDEADRLSKLDKELGDILGDDL